MKHVPRPYQEKGIAEIRQKLREGYRSVLYVLPTGGGKTFCYAIVAEGAAKKGNDVLILEHRKELIRQASVAVGRLGVKHQIIAPPSKVADIRRVHVDKIGWPMVSADSHVAVASVQTLARRMDWLAEYEADVIVIDECFPPGTLIDGLPIESIFPDMLVASVNHKTGETELQSVAARMERDYSGDWYRIVTSTGKEIVCTENHPIFTVEYGYISPKFMLSCDAKITVVEYELPELLKRNASAQEAQEPSIQVLQYNLQGATCTQNSNGETIAGAILQAMRRNCRLSKAGAPRGKKERDCILLRQLQGLICICKKLCNNDENQPAPEKRNIGQDEIKQSDDESRNKTKNDQLQQRENIFIKGWKREIHCASDGGASSDGIPARNSNTYGGCFWSIRELALSLQSRFVCALGFSCHRNRRKHAQAEEMEISGCSQNSSPERAGVARVEVYKRGSGERPGWVPASDKVYNLHVDGNNNYFSNGILVHNCHHAVAGQWSRIIEASPQAILIGVTATPCRTDGQGLDDVFDCMVLGPSMADLIADGYLVPFRVFVPPRQVDASTVGHERGDLSTKEQSQILNTKQVTGDAVKHYRELAPGRPTIVFCCDIKHATDVAQAFRDDGWRFEVVTGDMDDSLRDERIGGLETGLLQGIVTVDIAGEGTDIPCAEVGIMLRLTESEGLFLQQAGRLTRTVYADGYDLSTRDGRLAAIAASPKQFGLLIDHVGNVGVNTARGFIANHGFPDWDREWSLEGRKKTGKKKQEISERILQCPICQFVDAPRQICYGPKPDGGYCQHVFQVRSRQLDQVAGTLEEMSSDAAGMQVQKIQTGHARDAASLRALGVSNQRAAHIMAARAEKERLQTELRDLLARWVADTGQTVQAGWGLSVHQVRDMKPKALKEMIERVGEAIFMCEGGENGTDRTERMEAITDTYRQDAPVC